MNLEIAELIMLANDNNNWFELWNSNTSPPLVGYPGSVLKVGCSAMKRIREISDFTKEKELWYEY